MSYIYTKEELYKRALFSIDNKGQAVNVAFEPSNGDSFMMIIFAENDKDITGYHEEEFWDTLFEVLIEFDDKRMLDYEIVAV
tara:strand:- start:260 stop:505 length:246 start_codon:yes stop_codon:yes gene_type:complete